MIDNIKNNWWYNVSTANFSGYPNPIQWESEHIDLSKQSDQFYAKVDSLTKGLEYAQYVLKCGQIGVAEIFHIMKSCANC